MGNHTLVHLSDLHIGVSDAVDSICSALCRALLAARVNHAIVSGDVTHCGRDEEYERFERIFHPLLRTGRMTVVPGNHDRLGDDVRATITGGRRVWRVLTDKLCVVCIDSSGPHNRGWFASHGIVTATEVEEARALLDDAPPELLRVVTLHHHPLPLPEDSLPERLATRLGSDNGASLALGPQLIATLCGRCDLLLHGHRHVPRAVTLCPSERPTPLHLFNAGSSTELGRVRLLTHSGRRLVREPMWLAAQVPEPAPGRQGKQRKQRRVTRSAGLWNTARAFGIL